jgi:hypothetical protein
MAMPDNQKNFYDEKRYFQGKDNPGDAHPDPVVGGVPRGQIIFGVLFIGFVAVLALLNIRSAQKELVPAHPAPAPVTATK